jgi:hypothetical protein
MVLGYRLWIYAETQDCYHILLSLILEGDSFNLLPTQFLQVLMWLVVGVSI